MLLAYGEDLTAADNLTNNEMQKLNENFNILAEKLNKLNIQLIFMPVVDKYDLYSDFIVDNPYPQNQFFDLLRPMKKNYSFIDTKAILQQLLKNNVQDVFHPDDTHWSYKASEAITQDEVFYKLSQTK